MMLPRQKQTHLVSRVTADGEGARMILICPAGYDAGKKLREKKRFILLDTQGFLMHVLVHAADVLDGDGGA